MNHNKIIGDIGEAVCLAELVKRGVQVYLPFSENDPIDLIANFNGKLNKIQIKTSEKLKDGKIKWKLCSTVIIEGKSVRHIYTADEIDYYCLYNVETQICLLVPLSMIKCTTEITFTYPYTFCKTASANHNWEDYTFDKILGKVTQVGEGDSLLNCQGE